MRAGQRMGDTFAVPLQNISKAGRKAKVAETGHVMNLATASCLVQEAAGGS